MVLKETPFVSIVMPALNEERHIAEAIASVTPKSDGIQYELLVLDGGSTDRTKAIVQDIAATDSRVRLLHNDRRIQAAAMNMAAKAADPRATWLVRADCHMEYPPGFVERCVGMLKRTGAASVVVPMRTAGTSCVQRAIAAAQNSRLANGGSAHRLPGWSGFVDHGHHAAFDRGIFLELDGYDESFSHNEDAEFDTRLTRSGRQIYLDGTSAVTYYPRASLPTLARQYFAYGRGRASTLLKHRARPRVRQVLPVAIVLGCLVSLILTAFDWRFAGLILLYALPCIGWGLGLAAMQKDACLAFSGPAAIVMHVSWGLGFLARLVRFKAAAAGTEMAIAPSRTP